MNGSSPRLVLASGSPRRRELLAKLGFTFEVHASDVDENISGLPRDMVATLALRKASATARQEKDGWIIAADTLVSLDDQPLGKPANQAEAHAMLRALSGRTHDVFTGVCLMDAVSRVYDLRVSASHVRFRPLTDCEIDAYISTGEPMDKAGAYAIQGGAAPFVEKYEGSYDNIVGFPTQVFMEMYEHFPTLL